MATVACVPGNESVELKAISVNEPELRKHIDGKIKEKVELWEKKEKVASPKVTRFAFLLFQ